VEQKAEGQKQKALVFLLLAFCLARGLVEHVCGAFRVEIRSAFFAVRGFRHFCTILSVIWDGDCALFYSIETIHIPYQLL